MDQLIAAVATTAPPAAAPAVALPAQVAVPAQSISPADVAAYIDPRDIAAFLPAPPPTTELVAVSNDFFNLLENVTMVALFVVGFFLLARLLHAWMLHRSIRRALDAKSDAVGPLIDKLNKPYEHLGVRTGDAPGDDRNGLVLLAIGLAMAGFGLIQGHEQMIRIAAGAALFPAFVGIALLYRRHLAAPSLPRSAALRDDDLALNQRVAGGDRAAFQLLVLRHEGRLRAFLSRAAGHDADDLAQEAFVRAWQRAGDFRGQGSYAAWLMGIGWRLFLDQRRTARRREMLAADDDRPTSSDPRPASDAAIDADRVLAPLSVQERAALTLCFGHGWSHGEAAEIMGVPLGTLKSLVLRGRAKAQKMIGEGAMP